MTYKYQFILLGDAIFRVLFWKYKSFRKRYRYIKSSPYNGDTILPIYFGENFEAEIPEVIHGMNGRQYIADYVEKYINYAFESMGLLRENRKLFIS